MVAEIINLAGMDDDDEAYNEMVEGLKGGNIRAVFLVEKKDGSVHVGTNSTHRRDIVYDMFRLQELCRMIVNEAE